MTEQERRVVNHAMKILEQSQDDEARVLAVRLLERGTKALYSTSASEVSSYNREAKEIQKRVTEANDRGNVGTQYQVMKEYAKKYGWILTRKRTS